MGELAVYAPTKVAGNALCRLLARRQLQSQHYQDIEELLEQIRYGDLEILVLDLSTEPKLAKELQDLLQSLEKISVIMATPYAVKEQEVNHYREEGYYLLEKPICLDQLVKIIHSLL